MSNEVVALGSEDEFAEFVSQPRAVVSFTAPSWCAPCRALEPRYAVAASQTDVPFATVDPDKFNELVDEYMIQSVPTVLLFENSDVIRKIEGRTAPAILSELE